MPAKRRGVLRKDGQPRESNVGTTKPVVDDTNWRVKVVARHRIKFDDVAKQRYLDKLSETGRRWLAEEAAGVAHSTVADHLSKDPEFEEAYNDALRAYADKGISKIERDALDGQAITRFDPETGSVVQVERRFETPLRIKFLERYEREYHPKHQIEHSGEIGGAFVIPGIAPLSDWEAAVMQHDRDSAKSQDPDAAEIHVGDATACPTAQG